jgi:hypothetical protein
MPHPRRSRQLRSDRLRAQLRRANRRVGRRSDAYSAWAELPCVIRPKPRRWPNAAPGGTSLRRRTIMKGRVALADHGYYVYPGGYAYGARMWGTFTAQDGRRPWRT